jgi:hypothetical protein
MARFLITMLPANDLGLPTRMVPIARALADRGHEVAVFNPAPAPSRLISEAGLTNLPMPPRPMPVPAFDLRMVAEACITAIRTEPQIGETNPVHAQNQRGNRD